jgi:hypothetical protein
MPLNPGRILAEQPDHFPKSWEKAHFVMPAYKKIIGIGSVLVLNRGILALDWF